MDATPVATRLRRSTPEHDAYTVQVANRRVAALATANPGDARRWIYTTRWLHQALLCSGRLVVGIGVQWTPVRGRGYGDSTPPPATLQLCVGHRCLVFHLAQVDPDAVPTVLYRFLADPRVVFVGYGSSYDRRMLGEHYGLHVAYGRDLRALAGMGNTSVELMAQRFLGYPGISKPWNVAMSAWHAPRLSVEQVEYACVDAYLAFRLGVLLCPGAHQRAPVPPRAPPPAPRAPAVVHAPPPSPVLELHRAPGPAVVLPRAPPPGPRAPVRPRALPPAPCAPVVVHAPPRGPVLELHRAPGPALVFPRAPPPAPRAPVLPRVPPPSPRTPEPHQAATVDAAESSNKIAETSPGFTGSDTQREHGGLSLLRSNYASPGFTGSKTERGGLSLIHSNYASPGLTGSETERGENGDLSSDDLELLGREAVTDDDEEEEDVYDYVARTGLLSDGDYVVGPGEHSYDDEEDDYEDYVVGTGSRNAEDVEEQGYAYKEKEYAGIGILAVEDHIEEGYKEYTGILTVDNEAAACDNEAFVSNGPATVAFEEEGGLQLDGYHAPPEHFGEAEHYGNSTEAFEGGEDGYSQEDDGGDWYDQGGDGCVRDDQEYDAFY